MKTPPFFGNHNEIELLVDVDPCQAYKFDLKIVSQQGRTLGEIKDLYLPKLSQMSDFRPPKLSKMFIIERTIPLKLKLAPEFGDRSFKIEYGKIRNKENLKNGQYLFFSYDLIKLKEVFVPKG